MTLYSLFFHVAYEFDDLVGTYASMEDLRAAAKELGGKSDDAGYDLRWGNFEYVEHKLGERAPKIWDRQDLD